MKEYPDFEWHKVIAMRNVIIHEYFGVDKNLVWRVATMDLPEFKKLIKDMLDHLT